MSLINPFNYSSQLPSTSALVNANQNYSGNQSPSISTNRGLHIHSGRPVRRPHFDWPGGVKPNLPNLPFPPNPVPPGKNYFPYGRKPNFPNNWNNDRKYSNYVTNILKPYINDGNPTPPYYQGSYTIESTNNNKASVFNLKNGLGDIPAISTTANVNLASPLPKPGPAGKKLSELTTDEYQAATVKKPINFGKEFAINQKVGANTKIGTSLKEDTISNLDRIVSNHTNVTAETAFGKIGAAAGLGLASNLGVPTLGMGLGSIAGGLLPPTYATVPFQNLKKLELLQGIPQDFRSRKGFGTEDFLGKRIDGAAAASRIKGEGKARAIAYAAASAAPGGAYTLFNRETLYGEGTPGSPFALRNDFTVKTNASTVWNNDTKKWESITIKNSPLAYATEFRGDKVNVIDFRKGNHKDIYRWKSNKAKEFGDLIGAVIDDPGVTQDYIKFFFTGPKITFDAQGKTKEDSIMTFRAVITSLTDTFNPQWNPVQMIGRADPTYHYSGYSRDMNLDFTVAASDRDELKPIWRKLNYLASYTAPEYNKESIALKGPWLRITIGDLLVQQPVFISSLFFTLVDGETTWDTNIEQDPTRMQVPNKIQVSMGLTVITDYLPRKEGRMYTLAKTFGSDPQTPTPGDNNWLSEIKRVDLTAVDFGELEGGIE